MRCTALAPAMLVIGLAGHSCSSGSPPPASHEGGAAPYTATCPTGIPVTGGGACVPDGRVCAYGTQPRAECRDRVTCVDAQWVVRPGRCAPPSAPAECPPAVPAAATPCAQDQQLCAYATGTECVCYAGSMGWVCDTPRPTSADCPVTAPNAGTICTETAASCTYVCSVLTSSAVVARCADGVWTWAFMACGNTNP